MNPFLEAADATTSLEPSIPRVSSGITVESAVEVREVPGQMLLAVPPARSGIIPRLGSSQMSMERGIKDRGEASGIVGMASAMSEAPS